MAHLKNQPQLVNRVRRIAGQMDAVERALLADEVDCGSVLQQIASVRGAVNGLMAEVLEQHVRRHILPEGLDDRIDLPENTASADELISVIRSYLK